MRSRPRSQRRRGTLEVFHDDRRGLVQALAARPRAFFFSAHGFAPTTTHELAWDERRYPPKAILGRAYEFATGQRLAFSDFEGGKTGAFKVLGKLGFIVQPRRPAR